MPSSWSLSMTSRDFTSSCRASSLMRILLIIETFRLTHPSCTSTHLGFRDLFPIRFHRGLTTFGRVRTRFRGCHHPIRGSGIHLFGSARIVSFHVWFDILSPRFHSLVLRGSIGIFLAIEAVDRLLNAIHRLFIDTLKRFELLRRHAAEFLYAADAAFYQRI